jgi:amidase
LISSAPESPRSLFALDRRYAIGLACLVTLLAMLGLAGRASALNYVYDTNQDYWAVNDAATPGLDTGSIMATATHSLQGYGGIRMQVNGAANTPLLNGVMLRGFGLTYDGSNSFSSHHAVSLGGVAVARSLTINQEKNYARFFDTFTNEARTPVSVEVDFGGQLGYHLFVPANPPTTTVATNHQSTIFTTSSGDTAATTADTWVENDTPSEPGVLASASSFGPSATLLGTAPFSQTSDFLVDPFHKLLQTNGSDEANEYGYINRFILQPGQTLSLVHFVVIGLSETSKTPAGGAAPAAGSQTTVVKTLATELTATPDLGGLTTGQLCSIVNWTEASIKAFKPSYSPAECTAHPINTPAAVVEQPEPTTNSPYDVVGKSITEELAAMGDGETNSAQITKAYLDRIAVYNDGPLGFHAMISVNPNAMVEARRDDELRAAGDTAPLLGIPIAAKDIYDTTEMPTTGGSLVFENYVPEKDSFMVQRLKEAGAIIIGKANLSEFANSGFYSASAYGQVWNAFDPSKASIGSSGGSAVAVATSMAAAALGTQTGDSLWGPSSGASLVALRGTDGLTTCQGVMPLTYIQDFCGAITRTVEDQALVLNAVAVRDPGEFTQGLEGAGWEGRRPTDWSSYLKTDALQGKTIGWEDEAWTSPWGDEGTINAMKEEFKYLEAAGAKVIHITNPPTVSKTPFNIKGDTGYEGWLKWIQDHPNSPYKSPPEITNSQLRIPQLRSATTTYTGEGAMSESSIKGFVEYRQAYQAALAAWMKEQGVDAVVFPGEADRSAGLERRCPDGDLPGRRQPGRAARQPPAGGTGLLRSRTAGDGLRVRERRPRPPGDEVRPGAPVQPGQRDHAHGGRGPRSRIDDAAAEVGRRHAAAEHRYDDRGGHGPSGRRCEVRARQAGGDGRLQRHQRDLPRGPRDRRRQFRRHGNPGGGRRRQEEDREGRPGQVAPQGDEEASEGEALGAGRRPRRQGPEGQGRVVPARIAEVREGPTVGPSRRRRRSSLSGTIADPTVAGAAARG